MEKGTRLWSLFTGVALAVGLNAAIGAEVLRQPAMDVLITSTPFLRSIDL